MTVPQMESPNRPLPQPTPQASLGGSLLAQFTALLGDDVFFVPCERGTKKPLIGYVGRAFEKTKSPGYVEMFNQHAANIAVYLGAASGGLCAQ